MCKSNTWTSWTDVSSNWKFIGSVSQTNGYVTFDNNSRDIIVNSDQSETTFASLLIANNGMKSTFSIDGSIISRSNTTLTVTTLKSGRTLRFFER